MIGFDERPSHITADREQIPLWTHLEDVRDRVRMVVPEHARTPEGASLRELTERVALIHDVGKLTSWFRQHLFRESPDGPTHHSRLGALATYYVLSASGFEGEDPLVGYVAVAKHHGLLPDVGDYVFDAMQARRGRHAAGRDEVNEQLRNIDDRVPDLARAVIDRATDGAGSWDEFYDRVESGAAFDNVVDHVGRGSRNTRPNPHPVSGGFYAGVLQVWSALVLADKTSAASLTSGIELDSDAYTPSFPERQAIDDRVATLQTEAETAALDDRETELNAQREQARSDVRRHARALAAGEHSVATLTLPTGFGKTLSGLDAALTVRDERESDGRIVYALPFTSIIDQVAEVTGDVFDADPGGDLLTVHHHLSETVVEPENAEDVDDDRGAHVAELLGEGWRSGLVVTTFIQLFESLAGPGNVQSMKLPALYDSVVILDEPQALPHRWWPLVRRLVEILTEEYRATVIAMTATQPHLLSTANGERPPELVADSEAYFQSLDRVEFTIHPSVESYLDEEADPFEYGPAADTLAAGLRDGDSTLAVCNTIDSAQQLAEELESRLPNAVNVNEAYERLLADTSGETTDLNAETVVTTLLDGWTDAEPLVVHLTTRHRPCDRRRLLAVVSALTDDGYPVALVSTQLVEAGVDVSFDRVYRDFAPMDNLVQAAGRCNRSFDRDTGQVTVWLLAPPENRQHPPASAVYGLAGESLTKLTARALDAVRDGTTLSERMMTWDAVRAYFGLLDDRQVGDPEYVDHVDDAEADELARLSLIDQRRAVEVVVARTDADWQRITQARGAFERGEWDRLDELLDSLAALQVSIPIYSDASREAEKLSTLEPLHPDATLRRLDGRPGHHAGFFDAVDGLVVPDTTAEARLL